MMCLVKAATAILWDGWVELTERKCFFDPTCEAPRLIEPAIEHNAFRVIETKLRWCIHHSALGI